MNRSSTAAFSLLELMIVLTIMVALGAVAWPSLRRPMADSTVQQGANRLREQIADCRQSAVLKGQLSLMRFEARQSMVKWGSWNELVVEQLSDVDSIRLSTNSFAEVEENMNVHSWTLPVDIVVDEVQLDQRTYVATGGPSILGPSRSSDHTLSFERDDSLAPIDQTRKTDAFAEVKSKWYLPFLPNGQTRDAVIVLRDSVTGSRVALEIDAVTGMMRTSRLTAVEPGDAPAAPSSLTTDSITTSTGFEPIGRRLSK